MEFLETFRQFVIEIVPMILFALVPAVLVKALFVRSDAKRPPTYFGRVEHLFMANVISSISVFTVLYFVFINNKDILAGFEGSNLFAIYIVLFIIVSLALTLVELFVLKNISFNKQNYNNFFISLIGNNIFLLFAVLIFVEGWQNIVQSAIKYSTTFFQ
jgi:hypothetical protein